MKTALFSTKEGTDLLKNSTIPLFSPEWNNAITAASLPEIVILIGADARP
jgi:hypothetical protein